ncbi:hypothetical protein ACFRI7_07035 [Streptomyces sp. NPDC056716]|uniref:hypothetical protein n=1 Tax=unclassified Streptomyces TaxID=2593676 RepID=UPI0036915D8E
MTPGSGCAKALKGWGVVDPRKRGCSAGVHELAAVGVVGPAHAGVFRLWVGLLWSPAQ